MRDREFGFAPVDGARIYYETADESAGDRRPFVMIHAGVADSRQWNNEFESLAPRFRVVRYDMRGYGKSAPVGGEFRHLSDLVALLSYLHLDTPMILMGCSMGGGIAMDFALAYPSRVLGLIMIGSGPSGLALDVPQSAVARFREEEAAAVKAGDLERATEIQTQIWFDGVGRSAAQVDQEMRRLAYAMGRIAIENEAKGPGKRLPDADVPAAKRLNELRIPVLAIVGEHDLPYLLAAADYMAQHIPSARRVIMQDAAHLPNMDHPDVFLRTIEEFVAGVPG